MARDQRRHVAALFLIVAVGCAAPDEKAGTGGSAGSATGGADTTGGAGTAGGGTTGGAMDAGGTGDPSGAAGGDGAAGDPGGAGGSLGGGGTAGGGAGTTGTAGRGGVAGNAGATGGGTTGAGGTAGAGGVSGRGGTTGAAGGAGAGGAGASGRGGSTGGSNVTGAGGGGGSASGGTGGTSSTTALCPPGITKTITVAKDGSGQFTKVQAAIDSIPIGTTHVRIDVKAGTYYEQIKVEGRTNLCLVGAGATNTILTFDDSATKAMARTGSTVNGHSVTIKSADFSAANIAFENSCGAACGQAIALSAAESRIQLLNCRVLGYQDTLYIWKGTQYFKNCVVEGSVDFIYGASTAVFDNCQIHSRIGGVVVAPNTEPTTAYGAVILGGKLTAASTLGAKSVDLGRPWGPDGAAAFLHVDMGAHITAAGFIPMGENTPEAARFSEFQSTGAGANSTSRTRYQLSASQAANYTLAKIFGSWTPSYSQ